MKKKRKTQKSQRNEWDWFGDRVTHIYLICMLAVFPVFYTNKLFNLTKDKENFFLLFTITYLFLLLPAFLGDFGRVSGTGKAAIAWDTGCVLLLSTGLIVTLALSQNAEKAMLQMSSRTVSGLCLILCVWMYLVVRRFAVLDKYILGAWLTGSFVIYLFGILCACGINFLYIQDGISSPSVNLTPLGNTNFNACYVCLMLAFVLGMYILDEDRLFQKFYGVNLYMGFLFVYFIKTESSVIALIFGLLVLGLFALEKDIWFRKYLQIAGIYAGAKLTIWMLRLLFAEQIYPFDGLGAFLLKGEIIFAEVLLLALICVINRKRAAFRECLAGMRKYLVIALAAIVVLLVCAVLTVNCGWYVPEENSLLSRLVLQDKTFNNRGFIWKKTWGLIKKETPLQWLFGNGANHYGLLLQEHFGEECREYFGAALNDPHNEFLQMFMDMGLTGVIGYFGLLVGTLKKAWKVWKNDEMQIVVVLTLAVYLLQGLVNCYSIYHLPLLFIFLGLANGKAIQKGENSL